MYSSASSNGLRKPEVAFVFRFEPGFHTLRRFLLLPQELLDSRKRAASCGRSCFDGFVGAIEIVPGDGFHLRAKNEIGVALPNLELMLLRGADGAADNLKNVCGSAQVTILDSDGYSKDRGCAKFACGARGDGGDEATVGQAARPDLHRLEQTREGAARADGVHQIPLRKDHRLPGGKVRGHRRKRNAQVFKLPGFENALDEFPKTMVAGEAETGHAPAGNIAKTQRAASGNDARQ